jgi:hypothetical protein
LRYKATVMLVLALGVVLGTATAAVICGWTPLRAIGVSVLLLVVQQSAYLVGLMLSRPR